MKLNKKLNLNKHPIDCDNLSLIYAENIKITNDGSCLSNEEGIIYNKTIRNFLLNIYNGLNFNIVGVIPCNVELILFVLDTKNNFVDIFRYKEKTKYSKELIKLVYGGKNSKNRLSYNNGSIKGTFTYNVENDLIIAFSEYDCDNNKLVPLKTINLKTFDYKDVIDINEKLLPLIPEVKIPKFKNINYVSGNIFKGWYFMFIRYKIDKNDYTQWYNFGSPIYVDDLKQFQLTKYCYNRNSTLNDSGVGLLIYPKETDYGYCAGYSDYFSNTTDISNKTFNIDLLLNKDILYDKIQIGFICSTKKYTKSFKTDDIIINRKNLQEDEILIKFNLNLNIFKEYETLRLINTTFNYYNVKNIINYKNRLYISNFTEYNQNDNSIKKDIIDDIKVNLHKRTKDEFSRFYDCIINNKQGLNNNQYDVVQKNLIPLYKYLGLNRDTIITVSDSANTKTDKITEFTISSKNINPNYLYIKYYNGGSELYFGETGDNIITIKQVNGGLIKSDKIEINSKHNALITNSLYINTNETFENRIINSTLIPGEVYNFFIHFVDKYGHSTNGYRINNNIKIISNNNQNDDLIAIPFTYKTNISYKTIYAAAPINERLLIKVIGNNYKLNTDNIKFYENISKIDSKVIVLNKEVDAIDLPSIKIYFNDYFSSFIDEKFYDFKWVHIAQPLDKPIFNTYININNDRFFKAPNENNYIEDGGDIANTLNYYNVSFSNIKIPKNYIGYFISYEKVETTNKITGILTRKDFRTQSVFENYNELNKGVIAANTKKSNTMFFFSSRFDNEDNIKLDFNSFIVEGVNIFKKEDFPTWDYIQLSNSVDYPKDCNKPQIKGYNEHIPDLYSIPKYNIKIANSAEDNRIGLGTVLSMEDKYGLFNYTDNPTLKNSDDDIKIYRVSLLNINKNLYNSNNKQLIRLSDTFYKKEIDSENTLYETDVIKTGYNGFYTYDGIIVYEDHGVLYDSNTNKIKRIQTNNEYYLSEIYQNYPHVYQSDIPFVAYFQIPICTNKLFESKSFKNKPKNIVYFTKGKIDDSDKDKRFSTGSLLLPDNNADVFQLNNDSFENLYPKYLTNYKEDLININNFDKTIRRSAVIQDESINNNWRNFPVENYKNIAENKGNITNLIGLGNVLLVHTEHSLFMFDNVNLLKTKETNVQLAQPDIFDIQYKEVFTSELGFAGLHKHDNSINGEFGYIFYDRDTNNIYRFDNNQLALIDEDIAHWLKRYKPENIIFANDKYNNRLLLNIHYKLNNNSINKTLSYNYKFKNFVSFHSYIFDKAYNTKNNLYLHKTDKVNNNSLYSFVKDNANLIPHEYGVYYNTPDNFGSILVKNSSINIIINDTYELIKFLNYIKYKLYKLNTNTTKDYTLLPVEENIIPYAGDTIRIYNKDVDSGILSLAIFDENQKNKYGEYNQPFWHLGNWNFNYMRNKLSNYPVSVVNDEIERIYGNYFIIEFTFNNEDLQQILFETLTYNITKDDNE